MCVCTKYVFFSYQFDAIADVIEEDDPKRSRLRHVEVVDLVGRVHNHLVATVYNSTVVHFRGCRALFLLVFDVDDDWVGAPSQLFRRKTESENAKTNC